MCENEEDKARSRVLPPPPPQDSFFISSNFEAETKWRRGLIWGGEYWNIQKKASILQKELELELVKWPVPDVQQ